MIESADAEFRELYLSLYFDEDVPIDIVKNLHSRGFDVLSTRGAGMLRQDDQAQLTFAVSQKRVLFTHNRSDFEQLHQRYLTSGEMHYGIIVAKRRPRDEVVVSKLLAFLNTVTAEEMHNQLRYL